MRTLLKRLCALLLIPLLPIAFITDVLVGDFVTGVNTTTYEKIKSHKEAYFELWEAAQ